MAEAQQPPEPPQQQHGAGPTTGEIGPEATTPVIPAARPKQIPAPGLQTKTASPAGAGSPEETATAGAAGPAGGPRRPGNLDPLAAS